jgi:WD40 repeat protein
VLYDLTLDDLVTARSSKAEGQRRGHSRSRVVLYSEPEVHIPGGDNRWAHSSGQAVTTRVYDLLSQNPLTPTLVAPNSAFNAVSSHGRWLATCNGERTVHVWSLTSQATNAGPYTLHRLNTNHPQ